ncbi:L-threonine 3-dehydrogenase, partial [Desulfovibrio sp. OttesenSCG-928-C14]|nr:L-threonine 3-dehydrogenase [Desulfovibrio sp. OttesenSCG-928-C14]
VLAAAVCGTDVHIQEWDPFAARRMTPPSIIGHEFAGEVMELGAGVSGFKKGDIVAGETHIVCHSCELCRNGEAHVCYNTKTFGLSRNGCFAQYAVIPAENAFICDPAVPVEVSSLMEPLGVAVHAALEFPLAGKDVAVAGCGPIGVMAVAVAKKTGAARVIALEPNKDRAALAVKMGADDVVNPIAEDPVEKVRALTGGRGADVVLEFSGNIQAIKAAISYLKPQGKMAAVGLPARPVEFDFSEFVYRGLTLRGIAGRRMFQTWEQMAGLLRAGLDVSPVVTHVLPLAEFEEGLRLMKAGEGSKIILKPWA